MTTTMERYLAQVLGHLPATMTQREQIVLELRGHIEERLAAGRPLDPAFRLLPRCRARVAPGVAPVSRPCRAGG